MITRRLTAADPSFGHATARELLDVTDLAKTLAAATDQRALVIMLALVTGAYEDYTSDEVWRQPTSYPEAATYLKTLAGWGYDLSVIEQAIADGKPVKIAKDAK